jgi:hypothetical protein
VESLTVKVSPALSTFSGAVSTFRSKRSTSPALTTTSHLPSRQALRFLPSAASSGVGGFSGEGDAEVGGAVVGGLAAGLPAEGGGVRADGGFPSSPHAVSRPTAKSASTAVRVIMSLSKDRHVPTTTEGGVAITKRN